MARILLAFSLLLICGLSRAQVTNSSMTGYIRDNAGVSLPGATVRAVHEPSGTVYGTATQADGSFNIQNMRIGGPYRVEVSYVGYAPQTFNEIILTLGEPYDLKVKLSVEGTVLKEATVFAGRNPLLNNQRTGAGTNIGLQQINSLPSISRSITDFTRLTPQSGPSFSSNVNNANTFGGRDGRYNNVQINGANVNNAFGLSSDLLPGGGSAQPISLDAIEEIQVNIAPYDVRQSNFTGANVNAVTRSGNNTFSGSAYTYWRNQNFNGNHIRNRDLPTFANTTKNVYGARIGGPIIKNKLFFFVNGEYEKTSFPSTTWVAKRPGATGSVSRTESDSLDIVKKYLIDSFGYDPGSYENFSPFVNKNTKFLARLDYNINEKHKVFVSYSQLDATSDLLTNATSRPSAIAANNNNRVGPGSISFSGSFYGFEDKVKIFSAELSSNFNSHMSNQLLATYTKIQDTRTSPSSPFPFVDIARGNTTTLRSDNQISLGYELFSYQNDLKNNTLTITDNLNWKKGMHDVTAGFQYDYITFGNSFLQFGTGYYKYASVQDFINNRAPIGYAYSYPFSGNPYVELNFAQAGIYAQDKINLTKDFSLTPGVRVEMPFYLNDLTPNKRLDTLSIPTGESGATAKVAAEQWPDSKPLVSPRLGFNWDVKGNRSLQIRGGTGLFSGRVPFVWFTNQSGGIGTLVTTVQITNAAQLNAIKFNKDPNIIASQFPSSFPKQGDTSLGGEYAYVSKDLKLPQVWRTNIGVDAKLGFLGLVGTAEFIVTKDLRNVYQRNANLPAAQTQLENGVDRRPYWTNNRVFSSATTSGIYVLENTRGGESVSMTLGVSRPARKGFYGALFYTAAYATDISSNPGSRASSAWTSLPTSSSLNAPTLSYSQYMTPHRLVGSISYRAEYAKHFATTISLFYDGASSGRYSYMYSSDINGDGQSTDLIYIPNKASELVFTNQTVGGVTYTAQQQSDAFDRLLNEDKYLKDHKGEYAERYGAKYPFYSRFDARLLQDIFTGIGKRRGTLQLSIDMLNFPNFLSPNWGVQKRLNIGSGNNATILRPTVNPTTRTVTYQLQTVTNADGKTELPTSVFTDDLSTNSTWGMQLGVRLIF